MPSVTKLINPSSIAFQSTPAGVTVTNIGNLATKSDASFMTIAWTSGTGTYILACDDVNLNIPAAATITGFTLSIRHRTDVGSSSYRLGFADPSISSTSTAFTATWDSTFSNASFATTTFTSATAFNTFGSTISTNSGGSLLGLKASYWNSIALFFRNAISFSETVDVAWVEVTVDYTVPSTGGVIMLGSLL